MQVAIISDIHGNLIGLEAVLADIERRGVQQVVSLGDVALGPQPHQVIERLRALSPAVVMGNADAWVLGQISYNVCGEVMERIQDVVAWCASQLTAADRSYLSSFAPTVNVDLRGGACLLCYHGSPRSYHEPIQPSTPEDELDALLGGAVATVMAGGHTHAPMLRRHKGMLIMNAGSAGSPDLSGAELGQVRNRLWADYGLVSWEEGHLGVELRRVPFDAAKAQAAVLRSGMPHAEWWAKDWS